MQQPSSPQAEVWAAFYFAERRALTTYALSLAGNTADAQDLIQDVLVRMLREGRPVRDVRGYVLRCMRNLAVDRYRARGRRRDGALPDGDGLAFVDVAASRGNEVFEQVRSALAALGAAQREVIVLKTYAELTFREIAEVLECPLGTVTSHYARGIAELRALLQTEARHA